MSSPPALSLEDYDAIAGAVMETERGRWFLAEFARRNRAADTVAVLEALAAVEARLSARSDAPVSGTQDAARRVAGALEASSRIRASLADADEGAAARAFGDLRAVETDLREALRALGARETAALVAPEPKAVETPSAEPKVAEPKVAEPPAAPRPAPVETLRPVEPPRPAPKPVEAIRPVAPTVAAPKPPAVAARPLLDSLSEAEKAILFA